MLVTLLAASLAACTPAQDAAATPPSSSTLLAKGETLAGQLRLVVATQDLAVGANRFAFGIFDSRSEPIRVPQVKPIFLFIDSTPPETRAHKTAKFVEWPAGRAGVYVAEVFFDRVGRWVAVVEVAREDGSVDSGQTGFEIKSVSSSPGIGRPSPHSLNKTARDVSDLREITSSSVPDPDLYQMTIAEAVASGSPTVVTFATPAFCRTATCGPQVQSVSSVKGRYEGQANFIHVEVYENPAEMQGDISRGRISPVVEAWGLTSEPFTFVLDDNGLVFSRFEGFVTEEELEASLKEILSE